MSLSPKTRQQLKSRAHQLKPIVMLGSQGLTDAVKKETDRALSDHELIKIRVVSTDREARREIIQALTEVLNAELVQIIGLIAVLYRKNPN